ncbi:BofC C-terminal domain-containing protein [Natronospora cellulosivora (SeqCode)]
MTFVLLIAIFILWSDRNTNLNSDTPYLDSLISIQGSPLPENIIDSLNKIKNNAVSLRRDKNERSFVIFNSLALSQKDKILQSTPLIIQVFYEKSNILIQEIVAMPEEFIDLNLDEFLLLLENWQLKEYSSGRMMILYKSVNEFAPNKEKKMYLGIKDSKIAIFNGNGNHLKKITDINVENLPEEEIESLRKGIYVNTQEELLSILDGLISSINMD